MDSARSLSVILSFRNEQAVIPELIDRLTGALQPCGIEYELIFVNDASTDGSLEALRQKALSDPHIKIINMSRRFGVYQCLIAGLRYAKGAAVVYLDADLQDPPEVIPQLVEKWLEGADVVYTTRTEREGESALKMWITKCAYRVLNALADIHLPVDSGDFKLLSRRVVDQLLLLQEREPYFRGLVSWVGFKQVRVFYRREKRFAGQTHRPLFSRGPVEVFISALISFSAVPINFLFALGLAVIFLSILLGAILGILLACGKNPGMWPLIAVLMMFLSGVQLAAVGTLGLYIGRIYSEVRNRPHYIVESTSGFECDLDPETDRWPHGR